MRTYPRTYRSPHYSPETPGSSPEVVKSGFEAREKTEIQKAVDNRMQKEAVNSAKQIEESKYTVPTDMGVILLRRNDQGTVDIYLAERDLYEKEGTKKKIKQENTTERQSNEETKRWMLTRDFMNITKYTPFSSGESPSSTQSRVDNLDVTKGDMIVNFNMLTDQRIQQEGLEISADTQNQLKAFGKENAKSWWEKLLHLTEPQIDEKTGQEKKTWFSSFFEGENGEFLKGVIEIIKSFWFQPTDEDITDMVKNPKETFQKKQAELRESVKKLTVVFAKTNGTEQVNQPNKANPDNQTRTPETDKNIAPMEVKGKAESAEQKNKFAATRKLLQDKILEFRNQGKNMEEVLRDVKAFVRDQGSSPDLRYYYDTWVRLVSTPPKTLTENDKKLLESLGDLRNTEADALKSKNKELTVTLAKRPMENPYENITALTHQPFAITLDELDESIAENQKANQAYHAVIKANGSLELHYPASTLVNGITAERAKASIQAKQDQFMKETEATRSGFNQWWNEDSEKIKTAESANQEQNKFASLLATNRTLVNGLSYHVAVEKPTNNDAKDIQEKALKAIQAYLAIPEGKVDAYTINLASTKEETKNIPKKEMQYPNTTYDKQATKQTTKNPDFQYANPYYNKEKTGEKQE